MLCSFLLFAIDQGTAASDHQSQLMGASTPAVQAQRPTTLRGDLDRVSARLESPFNGLAQSSSEWTLRAEQTGIALVLYGFAVSVALRWTGLRGRRWH